MNTTIIIRFICHRVINKQMIKYNKATTVNKHEQPTAHQAGCPYDNFIMINYNKIEQRQT